MLKEDVKKLNKNKISKEVQRIGIKWFFNPLWGSQFDGVWERVIRTIKKIMKFLFLVHFTLMMYSVQCFARWKASISFAKIENKPLNPSDFLTPDLSASLILPRADEKDVHFVGQYN